MSKRIYVGNLPWSITRDKLEGLFSFFGEIEDILVVANKYTGRSRGFGFVAFKFDKDADEAIEKMDGKEIEGRSLVVKEAMPISERKPRESNFRERRSRDHHRGRDESSDDVL